MSTINSQVPESGLKGIKRHWRSDLIAAFSVSLVALPLSLGIALASGVAPMSGIISSVIGGLVVTFFRGGHIAINGPGAGLIAVVISAIASLDDGSGKAIQYMFAAVVVSGIIQFLMGVFHFGKLADIFPSTVIRGMLAGIGIIIFSKQLHVALGTQSDAITSVGVLQDVFLKSPNIHPVIGLISGLSLLILIFHNRINNRIFRFLPAPIWVLIIAVALAYWFKLSEPGTFQLSGRAYEIGPALLVSIPDNPFDALLVPDFSKINTVVFWGAVLSITAIASIETLAISKAVDKLDPYQRISNTDKDLIGNGIGTMVSGFIGGLPIIPLIARSSVNVQNNAKTAWSNFFCGLFILLFVIVLSSLIQRVPLAALAAILVYTGYKLAAPSVFRKTLAEGKEQLLFFLVTILVTIYTDLIWGIFSGVLATILGQLWLARLPIVDFFRLSFRPNNRLIVDQDQNYHLEINGVANFLSILNINHLLDKIPKNANCKIDLSRAYFIDLTVRERLADFKKRHKSSATTCLIIKPKGIHGRRLQV